MTRNEFIQRLVIKTYCQFADMQSLVEYANEAADKLEACGVPFDEEPKVVDADFEEEPTDEILRKTLKELYEGGNLSTRAFNVLKVAGAQTLGDVTAMRKTDLLRIGTCGRKTLEGIDNLLHEYGYGWAVD